MAAAMLEQEPVAPSESDAKAAQEAGRQLSRIAHPGQPLRVTTQDGAFKPTETLEIPASVVPLIQAVLSAVARREAVAIVPIQTELTSQQAADLLGVSRPFIIKLLNEGVIPHRKVGKHRRIVFQDLLNYKRRNNEERQKVLDELAAASQRLGIGY